MKIKSQPILLGKGRVIPELLSVAEIANDFHLAQRVSIKTIGYSNTPAYINRDLVPDVISSTNSCLTRCSNLT